MRRWARREALAAGLGALGVPVLEGRSHLRVEEREDRLHISTGAVEAEVRKTGYVSGVAGGSFLDRKTGFRDQGFGLDIVDWLMEPGSDEAYRDRLPGDLPYEFNNLYHGRRAKRCVEGPQICTRAGRLEPKATRGPDFVGVRQQYRYHLAAPGRATGSLWEQTLVFPEGKRWFLSSDRVTSANASPALFMRIDMPGHIRHRMGDSFSEVYLGYRPEGRRSIPAAEFLRDFAPDERFDYVRGRDRLPRRFFRAYRLRDPATGREGPWLAGMTLNPEVVYEAWCHQRGYVCMIQEFGGRPIRPGERFSAAFLVGFFDDVDEMERVYDRYRGAVDLTFDERSWRLNRRTQGESRR